MIVDDDADLQFIYEIIFNRVENIEIMGQAYDGEEAVEMFIQMNPKPNVIIMDQRMPRMDGITATKLIKELDDRARIIFVSGDESVKDEALAVGADHFFVKSIHAEELVESIVRAQNSGHQFN